MFSGLEEVELERKRETSSTVENKEPFFVCVATEERVQFQDSRIRISAADPLRLFTTQRRDLPTVYNAII